jgi:hypothetical protein
MDQLENLMWLRQDIAMNIQLADNKANSLIALYRDIDGMEELYLEAIAPDLSTPEAPKNYEIFNAQSKEQVQYQIKICRQILLKKYAAINKMIQLLKSRKETTNECRTSSN